MSCQNFDHDVIGFRQRFLSIRLPESSLRYVSPTSSQNTISNSAVNSTSPMSIQERRDRLNEILQLALDMITDLVDDVPIAVDDRNDEIVDGFAVSDESTSQNQRQDHHYRSIDTNQGISDPFLGSTNVDETVEHFIEESEVAGEDSISRGSEEDDCCSLFSTSTTSPE